MVNVDAIRRRPEHYGDVWCIENAGKLGAIVTAWKCASGGVPCSGVEVRVYDRDENSIVSKDLHDILKAIPMDECGNPKKIRPSQSGQVIIRPDMHVSKAIYYLICCAMQIT